MLFCYAEESTPSGPAVKKWVLIGLLVVLTAAVFVSTVVNVDDDADTRTDHSALQEDGRPAADSVEITPEESELGMFFTEGQHRLEFGSPPETDDGVEDEKLYLTALIIDTQIDPGTSLAPGDGVATSTIDAEFSAGPPLPLPGRVSSEIDPAGILRSRFLADADSVDAIGRLFDWGRSDVLVEQDPLTGALSVKGKITSLTTTAPHEIIRFGEINIDAEQRPGSFGYKVGTVDVGTSSFEAHAGVNDIVVGPTSLGWSLDEHDDRVDGTGNVRLDAFRGNTFDADLEVGIRFRDADGRAFGEWLAPIQDSDDSGLAFLALLDGLPALFAAGLELDIDRLSVSLPQGEFVVQLNAIFAETETPMPGWLAVLPATDGSMQLRMSTGIATRLTGEFPELEAAIALGYLQKRGDEFETHIELRSGVLTINGAPMQLPRPNAY